MTTPSGTIPFRAGAEAGVAVPKAAGTSFTGPVVLLADVSEFQPSIADDAYLAWSKAIVSPICVHGLAAWLCLSIDAPST